MGIFYLNPFYLMKKLIKKVLWYNKLYPIIKDSSLYHLYKRTQWDIANSLYNNPWNGFFIIGVTWTNGKTTTVNLLQKILNDNVAQTSELETKERQIQKRWLL